MIATDTNILVYAHRSDSEWHGQASACVQNLAQGRVTWALPWPCLHEFFSIVTHPRIFDPPTTTAEALTQIDAWLEAPSLALIGESQSHWGMLRTLLREAHVRGPMVHDARVAVICIAHGVTELLSADRDLSRFTPLVVRNPLVN
ncbi:MAG: PIN domain-containing protein [Gammaproteobacteria bacterium]|nr:PIN domain-containing protein [Gammaproteobacteria bacterium]